MILPRKNKPAWPVRKARENSHRESSGVSGGGNKCLRESNPDVGFFAEDVFIGLRLRSKT